ncbi:unnamed protein product [Effrenium voratum]|nr:unnamed protein product [Effrenium voratum]
MAELPIPLLLALNGGESSIAVLTVPGRGIVGTAVTPNGAEDAFPFPFPVSLLGGQVSRVPVGPDEDAAEALGNIMRMMMEQMARVAMARSMNDVPKVPPASERVRDALPRVVVTKEDLLDSTNSKCSVCLEDYQPGLKATRFFCGHLFCTACIREWLREANSCPVCRFELQTDCEAFETGRRARMQNRPAKLKRGDLRMLRVSELRKVMTALGVSGEGCLERVELLRRLEAAGQVELDDRDTACYEERELQDLPLQLLRNLLDRHKVSVDFEADLSEVDERAAALRCFKAAGRVEDPAKALEATEKSEEEATEEAQESKTEISACAKAETNTEENENENETQKLEDRRQERAKHRFRRFSRVTSAGPCPGEPSATSRPFRLTPTFLGLMVYLPAEIAFLTGLDDEWKSDKDFSQSLWQGLRHTPREHWSLQARLLRGLTQDQSPLREWGVKIAPEPLKVNFGQLPQEPVYFDQEAEDYFRKLQAPPQSLEVFTSQGLRPWPQVWTRPKECISLDRWVIFAPAAQEDHVQRFIAEIEPLVGELLDNCKDLRVARPEAVSISATSAAGWVKKLSSYQPPWPKQLTDFVVVVLPNVKRRDQYYYQLKSLLTFHWEPCCPTQMMMASTLHPLSRPQVWRSLLQQILVKKGAFLWAISPLPYLGRSMMVVGLDTVKAGKEAPVLQALSASVNVYFTSYFSTWRSGPDCGALLRQALQHFYTRLRRVPDTLVIYRGGVSESQEAQLLESELHGEHGLLAALHTYAQEVLPDQDLEEWEAKLSVAFIMARRSLNSRFMTEDGENLPSGSYIDEDVIPGKATGAQNPERYDFYMVSQSYVIGTARPTLYTVLYNTSSFSKLEIVELTYRLCAVYMTFAGMVSMPAPLKYATKLLSLLTKCSQVPAEPTKELELWRPNLFFV